MGSAALPRSAREDRRDGVLQPFMGIGDDKGDSGETSSDEAPQERRPARTVLGADDVDTEDLPVAVCVHARGHDGRQADDASALAHLVEQGIQPHIGVGALVEGTVAELGDLDVEVLGELGDLRLGHPLDAHRAHEVVDAPGGDAFDVGLADDRDERLLGTPAWLEERGQVAATAQLWDVEADGAGAGVPATLSVSVAAVDAIV